LFQHHTFTLVEAIRTIYGSDLVPTFSSDVEIAIDVSEAKEVAFTLATNKKHKEKSTAST